MCTTASDTLDATQRTLTAAGDLLARTATLPGTEQAHVTVEVALVSVPDSWELPRRAITATRITKGWVMNDDTPQDEAVTFRLNGSLPSPSPTPTITPTPSPTTPAPRPTASNTVVRPTPTPRPRPDIAPVPQQAPVRPAPTLPAPAGPVLLPTASAPTPTASATPRPTPAPTEPAEPAAEEPVWWQAALASPYLPVVGGGVLVGAIVLALAPPTLRPPRP